MVLRQLQHNSQDLNKPQMSGKCARSAAFPHVNTTIGLSAVCNLCSRFVGLEMRRVGTVCMFMWPWIIIM